MAHGTLVVSLTPVAGHLATTATMHKCPMQQGTLGESRRKCTRRAIDLADLVSLSVHLQAEAKVDAKGERLRCLRR